MLVSANENVQTPTVGEIEARRKAAMFFPPAFSDMIRGPAGGKRPGCNLAHFAWQPSHKHFILRFSRIRESTTIVIIDPVT